MNASDKNLMQLGAEAWPGGMRDSSEISSRARRRTGFRWVFAASLAAAGCAAVYLIADEDSPVRWAAALL